jgi:hypothetical protein
MNFSFLTFADLHARAGCAREEGSAGQGGARKGCARAARSRA